LDSEHLKKSADEIESIQGRRPKGYKDYRELLASEKLDAVIIATPPHWHALVFIEACRYGLDIYCEKPLAYDVREGQAMVEAAEKAGNIVQIGFQRRQSPAIRQAAEYVQNGEIGELIQIEAQIHYDAASQIPDTTIQDPPSSLDWDAWCGPAPKLPYRPSIGHFAWRLEKAYGNGHLVDWGIHWIDSVRMVAGLGMPLHIQASGGIYHMKSKISTPDILTVHFEFEECPVIWRHHIWGAAEVNPELSNGMFFYGEKGTIFAADNQWILTPKEKGAEPVTKRIRSERSLSDLHWEDFLMAVQNRKQPACVIQDGFQSTSTVQLAMVALENSGSVKWNPATREVLENPDASRQLKRDYRSPWKHPFQV
jgi:predicted dehydrogenase